MGASLSLTESMVMQALGDFITSVLPAGVVVRQGQANRVSEPPASFVTMTPILRERIETNVDADGDAVFTGSIAGATMTITAVAPSSVGSIGVGSQMFGVSLALPTTVTALGTGTGGIGTYTVDPPQTVSSRKLSAGEHNMLVPTKITVQCNVQGEGATDNSWVLAGALRDAAACDFFAATGFDIQPLYAEDPRQTPFINGEDQYEFQWTVNVVLQANPVISTPQQFTDTVVLDLVEVEAAYPF